MTNKLKNNWNAEDEVCPICNSVTKKAVGLNKQNLKRLFLTKPSLQDIITLFMIIAILLMAYSYSKEIGAYKQIISEPQELCNYYYNNLLLQARDEPTNLNNITLNWDVDVDEHW